MMSGNVIQPFWDIDHLSFIPENHEPHCCCGDVACAFLAETQASFDKLDQSLKTAGRLGQALLVRHEAYVADAEAERKIMREQIDDLEVDKQTLQAKNNIIIDENRELLERLEAVNNTVSESDAHVQSLNATLQSAQEELHRLNSLARRTEDLERELERFEQEQAQLHASLAVKTEEERHANVRRQSAERSLASIEDRLEAVENEARAEKERHVELMGRIERRRAVEKELDSAAGRLKSAAAGKSGSMEKGGSGVVSHFVKDILQDNANLQMSVLELRDLLLTAQEDMEKLRENEALRTPPIEDDIEETTPRKPSRSISQEIANKNAQEVHVHHHYHAPSTTEPNRRNSQTIRKPKKKRPGVSFNGYFTPSSGYHTPRNPSIASYAFPSPMSTASTLAYPSPSQMASGPNGNHRWSMLSSSQAASSMPSSPQSSMFDRSFSDAGTGMNSSRPTTPGTEIESPYFGATHSKRVSGASFFRPLDDVLQEYESADEEVTQAGSAPEQRPFDQSSAACKQSQINVRAPSPTADEDAEPEHSLVNFKSPVPQRRPRPTSFTEDDLPPDFGESLNYKPLRRTASHESLLSISGMDIHTLRSRPSQLLTGKSNRNFSSEPVVSVANVHAARPAAGRNSSVEMLSADQRTSSSPSTSQGGFSRRVGGWMFGRWGSSTTATSSAGTSLSNLNPSRVAAGGRAAHSQEDSDGDEEERDYSSEDDDDNTIVSGGGQSSSDNDEDGQSDDDPHDEHDRLPKRREPKITTLAGTRISLTATDSSNSSDLDESDDDDEDHQLPSIVINSPLKSPLRPVVHDHLDRRKGIAGTNRPGFGVSGSKYLVAPSNASSSKSSSSRSTAAHPRDTRRRSPQAELERMLDGLGVGRDDPRRRAVEREVGRMLRERVERA